MSNEKFQWHHRESNPWPSSLWRSASTNCATTCPHPRIIKDHKWNNEQVVASIGQKLFKMCKQHSEEGKCLSSTWGTITASAFNFCLSHSFYLWKKKQRTALGCILYSTLYIWGTWWRSWLRHCATSRKVAGSIPDDVIGIFRWHNPSGRTMALGLTQPLIEMSARNISCGVKAAGAYGWQPYQLHVLNVLKSGSLNLLEPSWPVQTCNGIALLLHSI